MRQLSCLIIEDEPLAAEIVQSFIARVTFLKLEKIFHDAISASEFLKTRHIDVIFLDIHLPGLRGTDFLKTGHIASKIIITSAHKEYALEGYELEIMDYLLKPFSFTRFLNAVNRLQKVVLSESQPAREADHWFFNVNKKKVKIYMRDILYIESLKDYVRIYTAGKSIVTKFQLGELEKLLDAELFIRVHRSYIVAKSKIDSFSYDELELGETVIPIGRSFSDKVKKELEKG
jgi:DNA-binding LytR/AlgR family response regulator